MKHASPNGGSDSEDKSVHGYLVEVTPGRELLYQTPWAFREAIRIGQITAESRIFHRATSQWISITEHPEYRKFMSERAPLPRPVVKAGPAAAPAASPPPRAEGKHAPAGATPPIPRKAMGLYQRMTSGLTELKRRLETAKPKRSVQQPLPRAPSPAARAPTAKPIAPAPAPAPSPGASKTPRSSTRPASAGSEESSPGPQSPPDQSGPRDRWTFYP